MENTRHSRLIRVFVLSVLLSVSSSSQAQSESATTAQARQLFQSGVDHYSAGQYSEALMDFERAYALKPHPLVQVNIANCYDKLNQAAEALTHFEEFLSSGEGAAAQRDEVRAAMARLSKSAGRLNLQATPNGAQGVIDRQRTAQPLQWLPVGRHRIDVSAEGYESAVRVVELQAGETATVQVDLVPLATPVATAAASSPQTPAQAAPKPSAEANEPAPPAPEAQPLATSAGIQVSDAEGAHAQSPQGTAAATHSGLPATVWISGGATFGLGVVAVVTGQLALAANREFDTNLAALRNTALTENQRAGAWARGVEAADRADALAAVTDILLAFTFVGVGLTTYFYLADRDASERQRMRVSFSTDARSSQLQLRGSF